ncbi:cytochrome P450 [Phycicoccus flavus]|uniref:cytochrome P450 n=1 Tax=Phycicoccus flavus TaxID=2502783 RepID=UPI000FEC1E28|nr:cytochrome P450 [Phycicoccus flavus]NHA69050.1 cytochrome P450 [Phycicoccus flavus]
MTAAPTCATVVPPALRGTAALRALSGMVRDRPRLMAELARTYDAVRLPLGRAGLWYLTHPHHAQHVLAGNAANYVKGIGQRQARRALGDGLLTSEGEEWREARSTTQPVFARDRSSLVASVVDRETLALAGRLSDGGGELTLDLRSVLTGLTLGVLGPTVFGDDLRRFTRLGQAFDTVQEQAVFEMLTLGRVPPWLDPLRARRFRRAMRYLDDVVNQLVDAHRVRCGSSDRRSDLVGLVLAREDKAEDGLRHLRDQLVTMLLAGHETTAGTLAWAMQLLAAHPEAAARVRAEARSVLGDGPDPEPETLMHRLPVTTAVVHETLRLHPPVWILTRRALDADVVGGYHVPAGSEVVICPYALHRDPRFWPAPEQFRPDRFMGVFPAAARYAYLPFGAGPRSCVGRTLGLVEAVVALARLYRTLDLVPASEGRTRANAMLTLRPADSLRVRVRSAAV